MRMSFRDECGSWVFGIVYQAGSNCGIKSEPDDFDFCGEHIPAQNVKYSRCQCLAHKNVGTLLKIPDPCIHFADLNENIHRGDAWLGQIVKHECEEFEHGY